MDQEKDKLSENLKNGTDDILNRSKKLRERSADTAKHLKEVVDEAQEFFHPEENASKHARQLDNKNKQ